MTTQLYLKLPGEAKPIPIELDGHSYGPGRVVAYLNGRKNIAFEIIGPPDTLSAKLSRLAELIRPSSVTEKHAARVKSDLEALPTVLDDPHTAWPWLVKRFPWLFGGIDLASEPYAAYLKVSQVEADLRALEPYRGKDLSQADVAQLLFGDRTKTGGSYRRRILAVMESLNPTTTTEEVAEDLPEYKRLAA